MNSGTTDRPIGSRAAVLDAAGVWRLGEPGTAAATVLFGGDVCPIGRLAGPLSAGRVEHVFADCLPLLRSADLTAVNLELPLCRADAPIAKDGPTFRGEPAMAGALASAGVDLACLANNHVLDHGPDGLDETLAALDAAAVLRVGAGRTLAEARLPLTADLPGVRLAIVNVAEGEFARSSGGPGAAGLDPFANAEAVRSAASAADVVLVVLHAGSEQVPFPTPDTQRRCRQLIDAGAAAVIAHHPHVAQGIEVYRGCPVAYSLGNFLFDWPEPEPETDCSFLLELSVGRAGVCGLRAIPIRKSSAGGAERMPPDLRPRFIELLNDLSAPLADAARVQRLWEQQCVMLFESRYAGKLARMASLTGGSAADGRPSRDQLVAFNAFNCETHAEALRTIGRLIVHGRFVRHAPDADLIGDLLARMKALSCLKNRKETQ